MATTTQSLTLDDIRRAHARIRGMITRTPVLTSDALDSACGAKLFFKCENLQQAGAFKARGATNAIFSLTETELQHGIATQSSGNHAAAVARAAKLRGTHAHIVMPSNVPQAKIENVKRFGGIISLCEPTLAAREAALVEIVARTGAAIVHPYNDLRVAAGQGTACLELMEEISDLDVVIAPVSGGGLLAGTAVAAKGLSAKVKVFGAEPAGADDAARSLHAGRIIAMEHPQTMADGLRATLGTLTFPLIQALVDEIYTVSEPGIVAAMRSLWENLKMVVEPSGAVPFGIVQEGAAPVKGLRVGLIISGGNLDLGNLPWTKA